MAYIISYRFYCHTFCRLFHSCAVSVLTPEMEKKMKKTVGMRIRECRLAKNITQEELAEMMCTKKCTISSYELGKIDVKVGVLEEMAPLLGTTVAYLAGGETNGFSPEVMQIAMMLEGMQNEELRRVAMEQMKLLAGLNHIDKE